MNASAGGVGLSGTSTNGGEGVFGYSKSGTGVYGISTSGVGVYGFSSTSIGAEFQGAATAILGTTSPSGDALFLKDTNQHPLFFVDGAGNVGYAGQLQSFVRTVRGGTARSFSPNSTQPTVEDTGTAQLVRGTGVVRLDPTFAASIEPAAGYRVFVTPNGETHELFVASKTVAGFVVREAQAGRSTVTFDYRIVATKLGAVSQHMAMLSPAEASSLGAHVRLPTAPAKLPVHLTTPAVEPATP